MSSVKSVTPPQSPLFDKGYGKDTGSPCRNVAFCQYNAGKSKKEDVSHEQFSASNKGTCSKQTNFVLNDDHTIASIEVVGGCNGQPEGHQPPAQRGMKAEDAIARMEGTTCGPRPTSCPDQMLQEPEKGSG